MGPPVARPAPGPGHPAYAPAVLPQLNAPRVVVRPKGDEPVSVPWAERVTAAGVEVVTSPTADGWAWTVHADSPVRLAAVGIEWDAGPAGDDPRIFVNGYQSWSPLGWRRIGVDHDPSRAGALDFLRNVHHADPAVFAPHELRSEMAAVLDLGPGRPRQLVGFVGGSRHDGTVRVRRAGDRVVVRAEAFLGHARLDPGAPRTLHPVTIADGDDAESLLAAWATRVGAAEDARTTAPFTVGWCSWYHWFDHIDEPALRDNLARAGDWPFDVFQLDDGYQAAIGDWTILRDTFSSSLDGIADAIRATGTTAGLWLAPFLAAPDSEYARQHPDHFAHAEDGDPLYAMFNPIWGGFVWGLDPTNPATAASLTDLGRTVRDAGYDYVKLDFTFSPNVPGVYADPTRTPAERVRAGYDAFRAGFGDDGFVLGCGAPLGAAVGAVDAMRIGPDVAPSWEIQDRSSTPAGYEFGSPATRHALEATQARQFMHRRFWVNDPDCVMLRTTDTELTPEQSRTWARAVGDSGGMVVVSDDLALLGPEHRTLLDEVIATGRAADGATVAAVGTG